jgi:hypothetical protein
MYVKKDKKNPSTLAKMLDLKHCWWENKLIQALKRAIL